MLICTLPNTDGPLHLSISHSHSGPPSLFLFHFYPLAGRCTCVCEALSDSVICSMNSSNPPFAEHWILSSQFRETVRFYLGNSILNCNLKILPRQYLGANAQLTSLLLPQGSLSYATYCPMSKIHGFIYLVQFITCFFWGGACRWNSFLAPPSWIEAEILFCTQVVFEAHMENK